MTKWVNPRFAFYAFAQSSFKNC